MEEATKTRFLKSLPTFESSTDITLKPVVKKPASYDVISQVGVGTYGEVFKAKCLETGEMVALKKIKMENFQSSYGFPHPLVREIKFLSQAHHINIVRLLEITQGDDKEHLMTLVCEYVESDLVGYLKKVTLTEPHRLCIMKQILEACFYAHLNQIAHRDIKPANILINRHGIVKLADWGMCRKVQPGKQYTNNVVTIYYRAPELLLGEKEYQTEIDLWAVGCTFAEFYLKKPLVPGLEERPQLLLITNLVNQPWPEKWSALPHFDFLQDTRSSSSDGGKWEELVASHCRPVVSSFLQELLTLDPMKRMTASQALDHNVFWGVADDFLPCEPVDLPVLRGDGVHEFQVRAEERKKRMKEGKEQQ